MHSGNMNIANAVINVSNGNNADNLLKRAEQFEESGEFNLFYSIKLYRFQAACEIV